MKKVIVAILLLSVVLAFSSCGCSKYNPNYKYDGTSLIGCWREKEYKDQEYQTYEFFEDGRVVLTGYSFGIKMQQEESTYSVEGDNTLLVNWWRGTDRNQFSISKDKTLVIAQVLESTTSEMELVPYDLEYNKSGKDIVGSWRNTEQSKKNEVFTYKSDYTGVVTNGSSTYTFRYSTKGSSLFVSYNIIVDTPVETMEYKIEGDILTLTGETTDGNTQVLTFERVE